MSVIVTKKRDYRPHYEALNAADVLLRLSSEKRPGWYYEWMGSLLFSAFAYEGYLNFLGRKLFPSWESFERRLSWESKTKLIADRIGLKIDEGRKPFQSIKELFDFRDRIAHPKPSEIVEECETTQEKLESILYEDAKSKEEKFCSEESAKLCLEQVLAMMNMLYEQAKLKVTAEDLTEKENKPFEYNMPLWHGGQSGSAEAK
jgi:hypothetical protein